MNFFVFDIGGTNTKYGLMDEKGNFVEGPDKKLTSKENLIDDLI